MTDTCYECGGDLLPLHPTLPAPLLRVQGALVPPTADQLADLERAARADEGMDRDVVLQLIACWRDRDECEDTEQEESP